MKAYLPRTAAFAWAPANADASCPMLATGTVAGALDESFNNDSILELWNLNTSAEEATPTLTPSVAASVNASARFNRLGWGFAHKDKPHGLLAAGLENGEVGVWDVGMLLNPSTAPQSQVLRNTMHKGSVRGLSFNQPQPNLIATGSVNAEIYVWDLKSPGKPYTPGARSQHLDEISSLAWNGQVPYVLATASTNGCTTVWDLRHKREIAVLRNAAAGGGPGGTGRSISALAWHPLSPTRVATATEDDSNPGIVLWDLRNSRAPESVLHGHQSGVLGLSWCRQDENMLLSCGKDNRTLCWDPQSHEIVAELPPRTNWAFDVQWNPRNPNLLATASFDGHVIVQSLQSTNAAEEQDMVADTQNMNADDLFTALGSAPPAASGGMPLSVAPKWLRRPITASFGFGGQLVTVPKAAPGQRSTTVHITEIRTEPHIAARAQALSAALDEQTLESYCAAQSVDPATRPADVTNWKVLQTLFQASSRDELVELLGFSKEQVSAQIQEAVGTLGLPEFAEEEAPATDETKGEADVDGEAAADPTAFFDQVPAELPPPPVPAEPFRLHPHGAQDPDRLVTQALILGDFESAVSLLVSQDRFADALALATRAGDDLLVKTQRAFFKRHASRLPYLRLLKSIVMEDLTDVVQYADLAEWQEIFVVLCTFAKPDDFQRLAEMLGTRLEERYLAQLQQGAQREAYVDRKNAVMCYLAAGRLEKVMSMWIEEMKEEEHARQSGAHVQEESAFSAHAEALQTFMEKVMVFQHAVQYTDEDLTVPPPNEDGTMPIRTFKLAPLYDYILEYVNVLTEQGLVDIALKFVALTPADYAPAGMSSTGDAEWAHDRLLRASQAQGYDYASLSTVYNQPTTSSYGATSYDAVPSHGYSPYGMPTATTSAMAPPPPPPQATTVPTVPMPAPTASMAPEPMAPSPYAPSYGTSPAAPAYNQGAYSTPTAMQAPPPPMVGAPLAGGPPMIPEPMQPMQAPPPPPPAAPPVQRDQGGWNDVPAATKLPPKRQVAPAAPPATASAITSPFPQQATTAPPPGPPTRGGAPPSTAATLPPPPRGPPRPSSAASSHMPPPPSPRTGLGMGHPSYQPDAMNGPGRLGADGQAYMRPQTPTMPGRPNGGMQATPQQSLRPHRTGPAGGAYAPPTHPGPGMRGPSAGMNAPPMTPRTASAHSQPPRARGQPPSRTGTPAGGGFGAPRSATPSGQAPSGHRPGFQYRTYPR